MWPALPASEYYGASVLPDDHQPAMGLPLTELDVRSLGDRGQFPRSPRNRSTGEVPSSTPAASPRLRRRLSAWPPHRYVESASESTTGQRWSCTASGPYPPGWSRCRNYGASSTDSSRAPSRLASRTRTVWQCQSVPTLSGLLTARLGIPRIELPPASARLLRQPGGEGLSPHSIPWRLVAHPPVTTSVVTSTPAPQPPQPSSSGSERDRPDKFEVSSGSAAGVRGDEAPVEGGRTSPGARS
ncbi:hypothetical protein ABIE67_004864 [Streptomyces sp. V4I8]